ncbi:MAG TPA: carbohydrate ABC transporter permease [Polyangiaceae bacterium]|nr:carbohydrate ABC transporter permease [Polyangiaceae bacterium]
MPRLSPAQRYTAYAGLGLGTLLFGFPLLWMVATSLSPVEQTLSFPPRLLPLAHYTELDGQRREVTLDERVGEPSVLVQELRGARAGASTLIAEQHYRSGDPTRRELQHATPGDWLVTQRSTASKSLDKNAERAVVPPSRIETSVRPRWENYPKAFAALGGKSMEEVEGFVDPSAAAGADDGVGFFTFFGNTVLVCVLGVIGTVLSNALVAYGFARLRWRGRDAFFALTLATLMIPYPVLMVPLFGIFEQLGWIGTLLPLWVPAFFGSAFNIFLMRQFFRTLPIELSEASRLDGASELRTFWQVILPLSRPVLAVSALFHFLHAWNDFLGPLLYLTRRHTFTLGLALQNYQTTHGGVQWHFLMAASTVIVVPVLLVFFFAQKTFVQGIATTGSKG